MQQPCHVENKIKYSRNYLRNDAATEVNFNGVMCVTGRNGSNKGRRVAAAAVHKGYRHSKL